MATFSSTATNRERKSAWTYLWPSQDGICSFCMAHVADLVMHEPSKAKVCRQCMQLPAFELIALPKALVSADLSGATAARILQTLPFLHGHGSATRYIWRSHVEWTAKMARAARHSTEKAQKQARSVTNMKRARSDDGTPLLSIRPKASEALLERWPRRAASSARKSVMISLDIDSSGEEDCSAEKGLPKKRSTPPARLKRARTPSSSECEGAASSPCKRVRIQAHRHGESSRRSTKGTTQVESASAKDCDVRATKREARFKCLEAEIAALHATTDSLEHAARTHERVRRFLDGEHPSDFRAMALWMQEQGLLS